MDTKVIKKDLDELVGVLQKNCFECLITLFIVGGIQASTVLLGSFIAGFDDLFIIFIATFILSFIPIIGAAPVAFFLAIIKLLDQNVPMAILMGVTGIIAGTIDNIIKPLLMKKGVDMDGALSLIIIMGSIIILGIPGLLIGPVVGMTVAYYYSKYA